MIAANVAQFSVLGIDPGVTGAMCMIEGQRVLGVWDNPVDARMLDLAALARILRECQQVAVGVMRVAIEKVTTFKRDGRVGAMNFGKHEGGIRGALAMLDITPLVVPAATWKRAVIGPGWSGDKKHSLRVARLLFPGAADRLTRKKDHGRAEALLIAEYGRRVFYQEELAKWKAPGSGSRRLPGMARKTDARS